MPSQLGYGKGYSFNAAKREKMDIKYMPEGMEKVNFFAS
jgi:hypothetical protein